MSDPWDIPPGPYAVDVSANAIYAAVGHALSEWEELDFGLAMLYVAFMQLPASTAIAHTDFRNATIFASRANRVDDAARQFFTAHPSQEIESEFERIICDV